MTSKVILASLLWSMVQLNAVDAQHRLERLMVVRRVLYVAAHPDDENTQLLAYLTHERAARTAYLSLTRGDGGQNLIGSEQSPMMGVIRSHELMEARKRDGAEQLFSRARDFGYSKRAEEALQVWDKEATLADVVWAMRRFRPHLVITRFPEAGKTHGHHLASAILAREAFNASGDPTRFSEQLDALEPWTPTRLLYNVPNRFMPDEVREDDLIVDIGGFDNVSGLSHGEIAAASRSMHKSQGFGAARRFGPEPEHFRHLAGKRAANDLFDGIAGDWRSIKGGGAVADALEAAHKNFRAEDPARIAPDLVTALKALSAIEDAPLKTWASREIATLLVGTSGLLLEARAEEAEVVPGASIKVNVLALLRGKTPVRWTDLQIGSSHVEVSKDLLDNTPIDHDVTVAIPEDAKLSTFPWLKEPPDAGRYRGDHDSQLPLPAPALRAVLKLEIAGAPLSIEVPVRKHWTDRLRGELRREVEVLPAITATPSAKAILLPCSPGGQGACKTKLRVSLRARQPGQLEVEVPAGYRVSPTSLKVDKDADVELSVEAEHGSKPGVLRLFTAANGRSPALAEQTLSHNHLPERTVLLAAEVQLRSAELEVPKTRIGYISGPGDKVADGLRSVGFNVVALEDEDIVRGDLSQYDAILTGVRAFNTRDALRRHHQRLFEFAKKGGSVVVQYATKPRRKALDVPLLPYPMAIGRGRVTDETAAVKILAPEHPLLNQPHAISQEDFAGWVQERGLYFGKTWDENHVTPLLAMADPGETSEQGSLLVANHGAGRVVYAGLSLFRQLPAGVPGAYRLLSNLLHRRAPLDQRDSRDVREDEPPPVLGRWRNLYLVVAIILLVLIGSFYLLTRRYSA